MSPASYRARRLFKRESRKGVFGLSAALAYCLLQKKDLVLFPYITNKRASSLGTRALQQVCLLV